MRGARGVEAVGLVERLTGFGAEQGAEQRTRAERDELPGAAADLRTGEAAEGGADQCAVSAAAISVAFIGDGPRRGGAACVGDGSLR